MITFYDGVAIAFYFLFVVAIGLYFLRKSKDTSDYFRAGGAMPWWVTGASTWMAAFSAWTFTGAAGKMYETGPLVVLGPYYSVLLPYLFLMFVTAHRFRRMRVVTPIEAVRLRFGPGAQQVVTWVRLPMLLIFGGIGLNAVSVFMSAVFGMPLPGVIVTLGLAVTLLALLGGSIGVAASDFVQMLLTVTVTITVAALALMQPDIGGVGGLIDKAPKAHFEWGQLARPEFIALYFLAFITTKVFEENSMDKAGKILMARSDRDARMTLLIPLVGSLLGPLIWIVPPMVAAVRHPDMGALFPALRFPNEAAFLQTAIDVLPMGMLGLLVSGIFAATLTTLDSSMNQGAGIFVRNFYLPVINPQCPERKLLAVSKLVTGTLGLIVVAIGLAFNSLRSMGLFDLVNQIAVSLFLPLVVPLFLGMFYRRTPTWSVWSTIFVGLVCSLSLKAFASPELLSGLPGMAGPYTREEQTQFSFFGTVVVVVSACTAWFFFTSLFYERSSAAYRASVDEFFQRLRTPIDAGENPPGHEEASRSMTGTIAKLSLIYGGFLCLLGVLVPNDWGGRSCFFACGGTMIAVGLFLKARA